MRKCKYNVKKKDKRGLPWGSVVGSLTANVGGTDLMPDPGRSHMPWSN